MKRIIVTLCLSLTLLCGTICAPVFAFTADISKETFTLKVNDFFPSWSKKANASSGEGVNNVKGLIESMIPMITTLMAVGATLMVIWGGYMMVFGGANASQTEAGKGIIKDAIIGLSLGLMSYVLVFYMGGKKLIGITAGSTGLPGENASTIVSVLQSVVGKMQDIAAIIAVLGICVVGIMYMMSHGDEEKTAAAKKYMVTILIGVVLAFAAWGIMSLINIIPNSFNL